MKNYYQISGSEVTMFFVMQVVIVILAISGGLAFSAYLISGRLFYVAMVSWGFMGYFVLQQISMSLAIKKEHF